MKALRISRDCSSPWLLLFGLALAFLVSGCSTEDVFTTVVASIEPTQTAVNTLGSTVVSASPIPTVLPTLAIVEDLQTPSPIPTPTTAVHVRLFVPDRWRKEVAALIPELIENGSHQEWELIDEPSSADIAMVQGRGAIEAGAIATALAVPFDSRLREVSLDEAKDYLSTSGSEILAVEWDKIPTGYRVLRVDGLLPIDDGYPLVETWSLEANDEYAEAAVVFGLRLSERLSLPPSVHLAAVGDLMLSRSLGRAIEMGDLDFPFEEVSTLLSAADITVGNLESALGSNGQPVVKSYNFQSPPDAARSLALAGFDIVSLANNHAMDFGPDALVEALTLLGEQGIQSIGAGINEEQAHRAVIIEMNGIRLAFLGYVDVPVEIGGFDTRSWQATASTAGLAWAEPESMADDIEAAAMDADVVVVILHSGYEFQAQPSPPQIAASRIAIESGADLVIGHHAHLIQGIEFYMDGVISYGLGNFAFNMDGASDSAILHVWFNKSGVVTLDFTPVSIDASGRPTIASPEDTRRILHDISVLTAMLNSPS